MVNQIFNIEMCSNDSLFYPQKPIKITWRQIHVTITLIKATGTPTAIYLAKLIPVSDPYNLYFLFYQ